MSTFAPRTAAVRVSRAAEREARRAGHPQADLDHLFLALVTDGGVAGRVLRDAGVGLDAVRDADPVGPQHTEPPELPGWGRTFTREAAVTVPVAQVWDLVATPSRRMEWLHPTYDDATVLDDDTTVLMTREPGRPGRGRAYRLVSCEPGQRVEWDVTSVARPQAPGYRKAIELEAQEDGVTLVRLRVRATRPNLRLRLVPGGARTAFTLMLRLELEGITGRLEAETAAVDGA